VILFSVSGTPTTRTILNEDGLSLPTTCRVTDTSLAIIVEVFMPQRPDHHLLLGETRLQKDVFISADTEKYGRD
jgi:hypothetical protein